MVNYLKKERKPDNLTQKPSIIKLIRTLPLFQRKIKKPTKRTEHGQAIPRTLWKEVLEALDNINVGCYQHYQGEKGTYDAVRQRYN